MARVPDPLLICLLSFSCEYVDSALGMGYGTTLTPLLLLMGYEPSIAVPAVLLSEFGTGVVASLFHNELGNFELGINSKDTRVALVLASCSIVGSVVAVLLAVELPRIVVRAYIGLLVLAMGFLVLSGHRSKSGFSWSKVISLGLLSSFNKAISGGGYGPVIVGGQILSGIESKRAVGITSLAEGLTCLSGLAAYVATVGWSSALSLRLALPLVLGALASTPLAAYSVKRFDAARFRRFVGLAMIALGLLTILKGILG